MCDEHVDLWNQAWRIARKPHRCCECGYKIQPGQKYLSVATLYDGRWDRYSVCAICDAHWEIYRGWNDGCIVLEGLHEAEDEMQYDLEGRFVLIDSNAADCMREQYQQNA